MHSYIKPVALQLAELADPDKAIAMKAHMKDQFEFLAFKLLKEEKCAKIT